MSEGIHSRDHSSGWSEASEMRSDLRAKHHYEMRELYLQFVQEKPYIANEENDRETEIQYHNEWTNYCASLTNRQLEEQQALEKYIDENLDT